MRIDVLTVFPEMFGPVLAAGIVGKAVRAGLADVRIHDLRDFAHDRHRSTDDAPFGGGPGMVMLPQPLFEAVRSLEPSLDAAVVVLSPQGKPFDQRAAERLAQLERIVLICGRYEGIDERVIEGLATEELSTGDYVVSGGEVPAMLVVDAVVRLLPGALGHGEEALADDSHTSGLLQHPQYTRPADFEGRSVPDVLLSGNHAAIAQWRRREALRRTLERRPDMLARAELSAEDAQILRALGWQPPTPVPGTPE
ncbi:MAG: tRNA (guanosine(37)-N1)-methyltransferase TrmD [Chloroflexota bacterium]|nr:tRNA (guanosine(37)-N1)-methyltransferase TrmD [Chloroflexota bacterium]MDE2885256.1 tRNA (guanosine(37)-N1)-methyltransferase TrmD [Chloroflexota bacterium]